MTINKLKASTKKDTLKTKLQILNALEKVGLQVVAEARLDRLVHVVGYLEVEDGGGREAGLGQRQLANVRRLAQRVAEELERHVANLQTLVDQLVHALQLVVRPEQRLQYETVGKADAHETVVVAAQLELLVALAHRLRAQHAALLERLVAQRLLAPQLLHLQVVELLAQVEVGEFERRGGAVDRSVDGDVVVQLGLDRLGQAEECFQAVKRVQVVALIEYYMSQCDR